MTQQYVSFDQATGRIFEVGPEPDITYQYFEIPNELADKFKSSEYTFSDFAVAYDRVRKKFSVKQITTTKAEPTFRKLKRFQEDTMYDLLLEIDIDKKLCYISTDAEILDIVDKANLDFDKEITFNFTQKNDPHVLFDTLTFTIGDTDKQSVSISGDYSVFTDSQVADCVYTEIK